VIADCHWAWLHGYWAGYVVGRKELEEGGSAEEIMMFAGYLMVTARWHENDCYLSKNCEGRFDHQTLSGHWYVVVKMTMSLRKYPKLDLQCRVVNVDEAERGLERRGWWSVGHFERKFVAGLDVRAKGVEDWPKVFVR
jgi:hypothetical protein